MTNQIQIEVEKRAMICSSTLFLIPYSSSLSLSPNAYTLHEITQLLFFFFFFKCVLPASDVFRGPNQSSANPKKKEPMLMEKKPI